MTERTIKRLLIKTISEKKNPPLRGFLRVTSKIGSGRTSLLADGKGARGGAAGCQADHLAWAKTPLSARDSSSWGKKKSAIPGVLLGVPGTYRSNTASSLRLLARLTRAFKDLLSVKQPNPAHPPERLL